MKKITAEDIAGYIINSDSTRLEDGLYYVHVDEIGNFVNSFRDGTTFTTPVDTSEWDNDESPDRFYEEFETIDNPDFMDACEKLANQINEYLEELEED